LDNKLKLIRGRKGAFDFEGEKRVLGAGGVGRLQVEGGGAVL